jgi:hypothetical protein
MWLRNLLMELNEKEKERQCEESIQKIKVIIPNELLNIALDSIWKSSGYQDWMYRLDPENPDIPLQKHIHIARERHTSAKNMQASWNEDGSRHDKSSFNADIGKKKAVRNIAKRILKLESTNILDSAKKSHEDIVFISNYFAVLTFRQA